MNYLTCPSQLQKQQIRIANTAFHQIKDYWLVFRSSVGFSLNSNLTRRNRCGRTWGNARKRIQCARYNHIVSSYLALYLGLDYSHLPRLIFACSTGSYQIRLCRFFFIISSFFFYRRLPSDFPACRRPPNPGRG